MEYQNIVNYQNYLVATGKKSIKSQLNIAQKFINFLGGSEPTSELVKQFCDNRNKKSIIKYFLIANNITIEQQKETKDYTNSNNKDIEDFLKYKEFTACKQLTIKDYRTKLEKFYKQFDQLTENNVREFLSTEKVTVKSSYINLFKQYFKFHNKNFNLYVKKNDLINAKNEVIKVKVLTKDEIKKIEKYVENLDEKNNDQYLLKTILIVYLYSGCRVSELINTKFSEINFKEKTLEVIGKGDKKRTIYLEVCPKLIKFLREHKQKYKVLLQEKDLPIILNQNYQPLSKITIQKKVKKVFQELKFDENKSIHSLRHSYGTILANNNVPIEIISHLLGHTNIITTKIYVDLSQQMKRTSKGKFKV